MNKMNKDAAQVPEHPKTNPSKKKRSMTSMVQRELTKFAFWGTIIGAIIGATGSVIAAWVTILPRLPVHEQVHYTEISASTYPFSSTNVTVEKGDEVSIIVQDEDAHWNCGWGFVNPEGHFDHKTAAFYSPSANFCELIGHVQPKGVLFRVGMYERFTSPGSGLLYLGANDDPNNDNYGDNMGHLSIEVIVRRKTDGCEP